MKIKKKYKNFLNEYGDVKISEIDEGLLGQIVGGTIGFIVGPSIGRVIANTLGVEKGIIYDTLTSRLVSTALGAAISKHIGKNKNKIYGIKKLEQIILVLIISLLLVTMCTNMATNKKLSKLIDSTSNLATKTDIKNLENTISLEIKIEGLKSEHRMIQATDRKLLDVNRQKRNRKRT